MAQSLCSRCKLAKKRCMFSDDALHLFAIVRLLRMVQIYRLPLAFNYLESGVEKDTGVIRWEIKTQTWVKNQ